MRPEEFAKIMDISDLVAVHLTRYLPEHGKIRSLNSVFPQKTLRNTIHFAINHPVVGHMYGNWDGTSYAVIAPLDKLCGEGENEIVNFNVVDTYFIGDVKLPEESIVIASPETYEELIEQGIVDMDTIMSKYVDERCLPKPDDPLIIEKDGIKYIILGWNCDGLKDETSKEIIKQGYRSMKGGMWNWSCPGGWGAKKKDQERIAGKLKAKQGIHSASIYSDVEYLAHRLSNISFGSGRESILSYLETTGGLGKVEGLVMDYSDDSPVLKGRDILFGRMIGEESQINGTIEKLRKLKSQFPGDFQQRIDIFLQENIDQLRGFIPQEAIDNCQLNI